MGRNATGSVKVTAAGKHIASLRGKYLGSYDTDEDARAAIQIEADLYAGREEKTLRTVGLRYFDEREAGGDIRNIEGERCAFDNHVVTAPFADHPLKTVTPMAAEQYWLALSRKVALQGGRGREGVPTDRTLGKETIIRVRKITGAIFKYAQRHGWITENPIKLSQLPKMDVVVEEEDEWAFLTVEEIAAVFATIDALLLPDGKYRAPRAAARYEERRARKRAFLRAVYAIAIYAGLRQGEIFGLHWEDIGPKTIAVRRTRTGALKVKGTKRNVPMLPPVIEALDAWRNFGGVHRRFGQVFPSDVPLSAQTRSRRHSLGGYFGRAYDAMWAKWLRRAAGVRAHVVFHDTRHTCASHLIMGTWGIRLTPYEIMEWLGHTELKTTHRYTHLAPDSLANRVADALAGRAAEAVADRVAALPIPRK